MALLWRPALVGGDCLRRRERRASTTHQDGLKRSLILLLSSPASTIVWAGRMCGFVAVAADVAIVLGFAIIFWTFKANSHASAIIDVAPDQRVVSTGPYAIVRHPMYLGAALLLLATPFALGSLWAIIWAIIAVGALVWRLLEEERYLSQHLAGYDDYRRATPYRLVPYIW
jgi:protein-S-isoprenylcysteine O-methyltransferase Ste14